MRKQYACLLSLPFCRQTNSGSFPTLWGKRCFANPAKCQNGWCLNSFLPLVLFFRLSPGRNSCGFCAENISPGSSKESGYRRSRFFRELIAFYQAWLFPEGELGKGRWEKRRFPRPPQVLDVTHWPQGKGLAWNQQGRGPGQQSKCQLWPPLKKCMWDPRFPGLSNHRSSWWHWWTWYHFSPCTPSSRSALCWSHISKEAFPTPLPAGSPLESVVHLSLLCVPTMSGMSLSFHRDFCTWLHLLACRFVAFQ